ncbi:MAG: Na/Pi cotransporter family protein [Kiritimatiellia bacterium]
MHQIDGVLVVLKVFGGLGLFLLGMNNLSEGLQAIAGNRLRKLVATATTNRFAGVTTGAFVTSIIQSSSIVTAMVVGFVSTSLMTLPQAINVIIGANIGTTATAWIIAVLPSAEKLGMGLIAVSALVYLFSKRERIKNTGLVFLALGLIFYGLFTMKSGMKPIAADDAVRGWFSLLEARTFFGLLKCITVSAIFTAVLQSSSATTAITMGLASTGVIGFDTAAASVLGMNIGTTLTAWLASLSGTTEAKRAALAHSMFNIMGVLVVMPFFLTLIVPGMEKLLVAETVEGKTLFTNIDTVIAYLHTGFNVTNTLIFIPFVCQFAKLVARIVPDARMKEVPRLTVLDERIVATPVLALEQAAKEVSFMGDSNIDLLRTFRQLLQGKVDEDLQNHIFHREDILDNVQREITEYLGKIMTGRLPQDVALQARVLLRVTDEFESISDDVASLLKILKRKHKNKLVLSDDVRMNLLSVHDRVYEFCEIINEAVHSDFTKAPDVLLHLRSNNSQIKSLIKETRTNIIERLENNSDNSMKVVTCMDMLSVYTRIREYLLNIGETLVGEKN